MQLLRGGGIEARCVSFIKIILGAYTRRRESLLVVYLVRLTLHREFVFGVSGLFKKNHKGRVLTKAELLRVYEEGTMS